MLDLLRDILTSPFGSFASIFSLFILAFWLVYWVTKNVTKIRSDNSAVNKGMGKIENNVDEIRRDLSYLKGSIDIIRGNKAPLLQSHSPVSLTIKGHEIADELKADELLARNWDKTKATLDNEVGNKNAYDIQQYCIETVAVEPEKFLQNEDINYIKNYAFEKGSSFQYYSSVLGVLIRDKYLKTKNIAIEDIDKHDPNNKSE